MKDENKNNQKNVGKQNAFDSPYYGEDANEKKDVPEKNLAASIFDIAEMFAICAAVVLIIFAFVARLTVVEGPSMETTLFKNEFILIRSLGYEPKKGDIVVGDDPSVAEGYRHPLIKRVIAVGGDEVDIDFSTWTVKVNGEVIDESKYIHLDPNSVVTSSFQYPLKIEEGKVFVMGDNRNHSADSRDHGIGQIDARCVVGKATARLLPLNKFTVFENPYE